MTVINPKSISGITSITMPSGADNVLTIHTTDGTERFRIDSSGNVKVGSAATISPDGDLFVTGVCTATTLSGAASGLTGALPAISAANLTNIPAANVTGTLPAISGANLTNLAAANLTGTIADGRFPATLPAASAANLTSIPAANVTGTLPALTAANLTNIPAANIVGVCTSGLTKTGGFGKILQVATKRTTSSVSHSNASAQDYTVLTSDAITVSSGSTLVIFGNYHFWMQEGSDSSFHGRQYLQREIGGNDSWSDVRAANTATFELAHTGNTINNLCYLVPVNGYYTHGQSDGTSIKIRIVHRSVQPSSVDLLVFQRNGNESNLMIMEVA